MAHQRELARREQRRLVWEAAGGCCHWCRRACRPFGKGEAQYLDSATVDHLLPISRGGRRWDRGNVVLACAECNWQRGNRSVPQWRTALRAALAEPAASEDRG